MTASNYKLSNSVPNLLFNASSVPPTYRYNLLNPGMILSYFKTIVPSASKILHA